MSVMKGTNCGTRHGEKTEAGTGSRSQELIDISFKVLSISVSETWRNEKKGSQDFDHRNKISKKRQNVCLYSSKANVDQPCITTTKKKSFVYTCCSLRPSLVEKCVGPDIQLFQLQTGLNGETEVVVSGFTRKPGGRGG